MWYHLTQYICFCLYTTNADHSFMLLKNLKAPVYSAHHRLAPYFAFLLWELPDTYLTHPDDSQNITNFDRFYGQQPWSKLSAVAQPLSEVYSFCLSLELEDKSSSQESRGRSRGNNKACSAELNVMACDKSCWGVQTHFFLGWTVRVASGRAQHTSEFCSFWMASLQGSSY